MAGESGFFGNATDIRYYTQIAMHRFVMDYRRNGYVSGVGSELAVIQHSTGDMSVDIGSGECWIQGCHHADGVAINLEIAAAHATLGRIDRVVMRNTIVGTRKIEPVVITGTAASSPVAPDYTRNTEVHDLLIADITVGAGVTQILTANITDQRANTTYCGVAAPLYSRMSDMCPVDAPDMNSYRITGSADPTSGTDGVTVAHRTSVAYNVPTGVPIWYAGAAVPDGYLECNGQSVLRATYPYLFAAIGVTFGSIDSLHFALPDGRGRTIIGYDSTQTEFNAIGETGGEKTHALVEAEIPEHLHDGVISAASLVTSSMQYEPYVDLPVAITDASTGSAGSGTGHNNLQPFLVLKLIVRGA